MKKFKVLIVVLILVLSVSLVLVGCTKDDNVIRVNEVTHSVFYAPLYVAINNGYFAEEGLKIELTNGGGSDKSMTAVVSGQADIGLMGPETAVYVRLQGSKNHPIIFGQLTKKDGSFLMGRTPSPNFKWADLAGKQVIGGRKGGMPAMSLEYAMKANDLFNKGASINYDVQFDLITAAFEGGTGDYCTMFEPAASEYQKAGKGYIVASVGEAAGEIPYTCFMATKNYITKHSDKVSKFMRAINKGIKFVMTSSDAAVSEALKSAFPSNSLGTLESAVKSYKSINAFMEDARMSETQFNHMLEILKQSGTIKENVAFAELVDNSILEAL